MVNPRDIGILGNIVEHCIRIEETLIGVTIEIFNTNKGIQDILCFNILQIGELAKHLSPDFLSCYKEIPWRKTMDMRNRIVHGYGTIKMERVWKTAITDIKPLKDYCEKIIKEN